ncbi:hypothetical protein C1646_774487 [Rhizophagus diaphanus]|nr:hypothetical protein C1646_774487 [Rhizophagus diaphanus] [Rhizophagus sp. MUCL 43196]
MACSKIFLQYFRNDFSTLHSCILVNRLWCHDKTKLIEYGIITELLFPSINTLFNYSNFIQHLNTYKTDNYLENIGFGLSRNNEYKIKLFKLVKIKIKFLEIFGIFGFNDQNIYSVLNLIKNVQQNLKYSNLLGKLILNINNLEIFLKNSQSIFIKKLLIGNLINRISEDILPCIKKYIMKEKRVTYLAIDELYHNNEMKNLFELKR